MFFQDHLFISSINLVCILIILYRNGVFFNRAIGIWIVPNGYIEQDQFLMEKDIINKK